MFSIGDLATVAGPSEKSGWENRKRAEEKEKDTDTEMDGDESDKAAWAEAGGESSSSSSGKTSSAQKASSSSNGDSSKKDEDSSESSDDADEMVEWRHAPHVLAMSATPIPRTLAMCKHGEMALSSIDEKPAGRLPIYTKLSVGPNAIDEAHRAMVEEVNTGGQCYVITPLVNASTADSFERFKSA